MSTKIENHQIDCLICHIEPLEDPCSIGFRKFPWQRIGTIPFQVGNCTSPALSFPGGNFPGGSRVAGGLGIHTRIIFFKIRFVLIITSIYTHLYNMRLASNKHLEF